MIKLTLVHCTAVRVMYPPGTDPVVRPGSTRTTEQYSVHLMHPFNISRHRLIGLNSSC
jgi:hypothetical protein